MRKLRVFILSIILTLTGIQSSYGTLYYSINIDYKTISAMVGAYAEEQVIEMLNQQELEEILGHYKNAEIATAGIFASKWLDRQALKDAGRFGDAQKNYYYRRIYQLVTVQIMPRIWNIALLCIKHPDRAMHWGPFLYKVTEDVKHLCMQFEQIVCNGKVTFQDCVFFCLSDNFKQLFNLEYMGDIDWKNLFRDLGDFVSGLGEVDIAADIKKAKEEGAGVASAGGSYISKIWNDVIATGRKVFNGDCDYKGKIKELKEVYDKYDEVYDRVMDGADLQGKVMGFLGTADSAGLVNLLNVDDYNVSQYINDYLSEIQGQYYKQRWYIGYKDEGSEIICDYVPPQDNNSIFYSSEWYRYDANGPAPDERVIIANSEGYAGWNQDKVNMMNEQNDGYKYSFSYTNRYLRAIDIYGRRQWAAAYSIQVKRTRNDSGIVYEEVFDSYDMDFTVFKAKMEAKLNEYNTMQLDSETKKEYYLASDEKIYYSESDIKRMNGCESVSFTKNCSGATELARGGFSWKENGSHNHSDVRQDTKQYAMESTLGEMPSTSVLDDEIEARQEIVDELQHVVDSLKREENILLDSISNCSYERASYFRALYAENKVELNQKERELQNAKYSLWEAEDNRDELIDDYKDELDGTYRIPAAMHELEAAFDIIWEDNGYWSGSTFIRNGTIPSLQDGHCVFSATVSVQRKEKHFLGIRIHRAILHVDYDLSSNYNSSSTIEILELDPEWNDEYKNEQVNNRLHELQKEYPSCNIEIEYAYQAPVDTPEDTDVVHLLWVSDRLRIAREIEYRLSRINARLIQTEKFMLQRENLLSYLRRSIFGGLPNGSKQKFGGKALRRWRRARTGVVSGEKPNEIDYSDIDSD